MTGIGRYYILDADGEPERVDDALVWAEWFETSHVERVVLQTRVYRGRVVERPLARARGGVQVSTVFLGLNHAFFDDGPPMLWESMIFGGPFSGEAARYRSKLAALQGHDRMVARVQKIRRIPRRLKRALRKEYAGQPLTRGETRAVERFAARHAREYLEIGE